MKQKTFVQILKFLRKNDKRITADIFFHEECGYWTARFLEKFGGGIIEAGDGDTPQEAMRSCAWMWNEVHGKNQSNTRR